MEEVALTQSDGKSHLGQVSYYAKVKESKETGKGTWNVLEVDIYESVENSSPDRVIGSFQRNYPSLYHCFHPFLKDGKWYALYSKNYMTTHVMTLPDCEDITNEDESDAYGFCPVDYYVPFHREGDEDFGSDDGIKGEFGFVSGCVWGDDTSWKLRYLDLSRVQEGIIKMDERFGYVELHDMRLNKAVDVSDYWKGTITQDEETRELNYTTIDVAGKLRFDLETGKLWTGIHEKKQEYQKILNMIDQAKDKVTDAEHIGLLRDYIESKLKEL